MDDLPQEVQNRESATFDFGKVRQLLTEAYYRGPSVHEAGSHGGMRQFALRGDPASHRKSILRKARETDLIEETPRGYATTPHGYDILSEITVCSDCGQDEAPIQAGIRTGKHFGYILLFTSCTSCNNPTSATNTALFQRNDDELEEAVRIMESHDVVCYLNGDSIDQVKSYLGLDI